MNKTLIIGIIAAAVLIVGGLALSGGQATGELTATGTVYKGAGCSCCGGWQAFMENQGAQLEGVMSDDVNAIKDEYGIPPNMRSCHTSVVEGYVVEGHVPLEAMQDLLEERPEIKGIMVPGMPSGTPGMPGQKVPVTVYALNQDGTVTTFGNY